MKGYHCTGSGKIFLHDPRPGERSNGVEEVVLSGRGKVYSFTTLHSAAERFEKDLPFQIAIIQLEEGPRLTARIQGDRVKIDDPVQFVERRNGVWFFARSR